VTQSLTDLIKRAKEICEKVDPEPWRWRKFGEWALVADHGPRRILISGGWTVNEGGTLVPMEPGQPFPDYVCESRTLLPLLADEVERLTERLEKANTVCELVGHWKDEIECPPTHISDAYDAYRAHVKEK